MSEYKFWTACGAQDAELIVTDVQVPADCFVKYGYIDAVQRTEEGAARLYFRMETYGEAEGGQIRREAAEWEIYIEETEGYDMGYGTSGEDTDYRSRDIYESEILVSDGHFIGVVGSNTSGTRSNPTKFGSKNRIALIANWNGNPMLYESHSESFSSDDHESWSSSGYYLRKK